MCGSTDHMGEPVGHTILPSTNEQGKGIVVCGYHLVCFVMVLPLSHTEPPQTAAVRLANMQHLGEFGNV